MPAKETIDKLNSQPIKKTITYADFLKEVFADLETSINFLKNGKEIPSYHKLLGIRQNIVNLYNDIANDPEKANMRFRENNENNKDT